MIVKYNYLKCAFTLIVGISFSTSTWAQYKSVFGQSQTSWNVLLRDFPAHIDEWTDSVYVAGDTSLNGYDYKKIRAQSWYDTSKQRYAGLLREDTINGKVWYIAPYVPGGNEELIMDMTLSKGDSFFSPRQGLMIGVDSVYYKNNRKHVRFDYYETYTPIDSLVFEMIEGIGTSYGVVYPDTNLRAQSLLLCSMKDSNREYMNSFYNGGCVGVTIGLPEVLKEAQIKVYPTPTKGVITIDMEDRERLRTLCLYNVNGIKVKELFVLQRDIDLSALPSGVYFLVFGFESENVSKRIVIE